MTVEWDARGYHRVSGPMEAMGLAALDRLALAGDETVLDAGCGTGRVTAHLAQRLPRGRVIAVDLSDGMVAAARAFLDGLADVRHADLLELELEEPVDAVFSTATFHWIADHDRLFAHLFAALRPGGRLVAQCGGRGNIARVLAAAAEVGRQPRFTRALEGFVRPSYFAGPEETAGRLEAAGFDEVAAWLELHPILPEDPVEYLATITLRDHLARVDEALRTRFAAEVAELLGAPVELDYVRLNIDARRPLRGPAGLAAGRAG